MESYRPKPIKIKLSTKMKNYISYCERYYHINHGRFPKSEEAAYALKYSLIEINYFLQNSEVRGALIRRGMDVEQLLSHHAQTYLSPIQIACAVTVANFADPRSVKLKLEQLGVSPNQYYAWLKSPAYKDFTKDLADQALDNIRPEAVAVFSQLVREGNIRALQMYFDMTGAFQDDSQVNDLKMTLQRLIESVQRHVHEPDKLQAIAADLHLAIPAASELPVAVVSEIEN
jgi:hypothetical protein